MATLIPNNLQISQTFKIHKIMATSKSFFGKRRGSTKNFTFAVFNGKQVTKEKAEQVKNPRTLAQMKNRMILTTSSAAYAAMKEIVDHSFQGFIYGLQNMSRFQSVNNKLLRANLEAATSQFAYANYGDAHVLPGAYVISEGSLAPIPTAMFACAISAADSVAFTIQPGVTAAELTANAIISALGLQVGELATLCFLADCGTEAGYKFGFIRLTVKAAGDVQLTAQNLTDYFTIESNAPVAITSVTDGTAVITATIDGVQADGGLCYGCIHSANENGTWKRSDCRMTIADGTALEPTATQAIATYPVGGSKILNDGDIPGGHEASVPDGFQSLKFGDPESLQRYSWPVAGSGSNYNNERFTLEAMPNSLDPSLIVVKAGDNDLTPISGSWAVSGDLLKSGVYNMPNAGTNVTVWYNGIQFGGWLFKNN